MNTILVLAEHDNLNLKSATANTIRAALAFEGEIQVLVAGFNCQAIAEKVASLEGVKKVLLADAACYEYGLAENISALMHRVITGTEKTYNYVLAPATTYGKNILPRVAAKSGVSQISDVIKIINKNTFVRPIYAGNAVLTLESIDHLKVMTVRTTAFEAVSSNQAPVDIIRIAEQSDKKLSQFISQEAHQTKRPELTSARIVIAGGRGLQSAENFKMLEALADKLNAAVGASRAAVDSGFVPNDYQVGQTGKMVAPELYIAVGISGAIQHLAGMKDSKIIVAINKDPAAPIFQVADYGIIGDLFEILPEFSHALDALN